MADLAFVNDEIIALAQEMGSLAQRVEQGEVLDITPIKKRVKVLCEQATRLPRPVDPAIAHNMNLMLGNMNQLSQAIRQQQGEVMEKLSGQSARRKATAAYGLAPRTGGPAKKS